MARAVEPPPPGVIHDIGYQHYSGPRLGRGYRMRSLYVHSLRTAYGLGRTARFKVFPFMLFGVFCIVAVVLVMIRSLSGQAPIQYDQFPGVMPLPLIVFLAAVAPELVSRDLRATLLPLYFSRPLRRSDYPLAKLAALASAVFILLVTPLVIMFLGAAFSTGDGLSGVWHEWEDLMPALANAAIYSIVLSALTLLIASVTKRQVFAAGAIVAVFLVTLPIAGLLSEVGSRAVQDLAGLWSPMTLLGGLERWLFDTPGQFGDSYGWVYGLITIVLYGGCVALLIQRYRRVTA